MNTDCNVTVIPGEYSELKNEYITLKKEVDVTKQELYAARRNVQVLEALQNDYQSEVDLLQCNNDAEKKTLEDKILQLEDIINNLKLKFNDKIHCLEQNLLKCEEENVLLKNEIDILKKSTTSVNNDTVVTKLNDEILNLREENLILIETVEEMKESLKEFQNQHLVFEESILEAKNEIYELKNSLSCKKEELVDANEMIDKLNLEVITLKNELDSYKSQPVEKCQQGNSLFAEVDDRRVYLQKTINNMKQEYMTMKQERAKHVREIHHLKIENKKVLEKWKADVNEKDDDHYTELKSLKNRIAVLENLLESCQNELNAKAAAVPKDSFEGYEFYSVMIQNKNKQIEELRQQLSSRTLTEVLLSKALNEANEAKRKWKLEAAMKQSELELLQVETENVKQKTSENNCTTKESSSLKNIKTMEVEHNPKAGILKLTQKSNVNKLKEVEDLYSKEKSNFECGMNAQTETNSACLPHGILSQIQNVTNRSIKTENDDLVLNFTPKCETFKETADECSIPPTPEKSNISVIVLDDHSSDENVDLIKSKISTEVQKNENEELVEENKENFTCNVQDDIDTPETAKKVTFSENTISPKTATLRKCKKVVVCKPVIFSSSQK